jgi:dephospho-coA kinase
LARINSQMRLEDKRAYADVIIDNNGTPLDLKEQLDIIWNKRIESVL